MNFRTSLTPRSRQQGNTIIGIVIGLVIGLAIAVVVALVINKGSTPFTDKGRASKVAEPTAGQAADPNKPMYGNKEAVREAAKDFAKETPKAPPPADPLQAVVDKIQAAPAAPAPAPAPAPVEKPKAAAPAIPAAANVTPTPAKPAPAADSGDDKFIYYLQAGAFREVADAESARAKLALLGFEANLSDRATDTGVLHRVRLGPYNQVETMNKVRSKLSENGIDVAVVRNQK
ncbi:MULTISPECIES: SPOR domain-containing protein [unclassified Duganella]|uniref:SPOR domain-containing protein n=1 Tax=unclassified Duganella TaxID=2636909 RepID=UPI000E341B56|nr:MULTISPECIES: SPOR domain-containing protein [unclassified Duganella]RFP10634.1 SPOR domain-containing protein [Duganella sp. BJB475]RFP27339.1 SPOR domain-containing protein [Duganella sp. BJB476]